MGLLQLLMLNRMKGMNSENWTGNVYLADFMMTTHSQENNKLTQGIEMRCLDITSMYL